MWFIVWSHFCFLIYWHPMRPDSFSYLHYNSACFGTAYWYSLGPFYMYVSFIQLLSQTLIGHESIGIDFIGDLLGSDCRGQLLNSRHFCSVGNTMTISGNMASCYSSVVACVQFNLSYWSTCPQCLDARNTMQLVLLFLVLLFSITTAVDIGLLINLQQHTFYACGAGVLVIIWFASAYFI